MFKKKETMHYGRISSDRQSTEMHLEVAKTFQQNIHPDELIQRDRLARDFFEYLKEIDHFQNKLNKGDLT